MIIIISYVKLNFVVGQSEFELFMTGQVYSTYFLFINNGNHPNLIPLNALSEIKKLKNPLPFTPKPGHQLDTPWYLQQKYYIFAKNITIKKDL